jgi:hypothetical protein
MAHLSLTSSELSLFVVVSGAKYLFAVFHTPRIFSGSFEIKKGHDYDSSGYDFHLRIGGINNGILCFHHNLLMDLCARYSVIPGIFI